MIYFTIPKSDKIISNDRAYYEVKNEYSIAGKKSKEVSCLRKINPELCSLHLLFNVNVPQRHGRRRIRRKL